MLHIKPVSEQDASPNIHAIYSDINTTFKTPVVPLLFRYLANYEEYLVYLWHKLKTNIHSSYFQNTYKVINHDAYTHMQEIYKPSDEIQQFFHTLSLQEKEQVYKTVLQLEETNTQLFLLAIGIREGVKGVFVGQETLPYMITRASGEAIFEILSGENKQEEQENTRVINHLLAPLFGSTSMKVIRYPDFFVHVSHEMEKLVKRELYLTKRVALEYAGLRAVAGLQYPLGTSFAEISYFAAGKPFFNELLYILSETFPSQFPRLVMTTQVMQSVLQQKAKIQ